MELSAGSCQDDLRSSAPFNITGEARTLSGEERALLSATTVNSNDGGGVMTGTADAPTTVARRFPDGFYWGVAWNEDGEGVSIWDTYAHTPGNITRACVTSRR
jgi:Glycosyl hydrolase family 1